MGCPGGSFDDSSSPTPTLYMNSSGCTSPCLMSLTVTDNNGLPTECYATVSVSDTLSPFFTYSPLFSVMNQPILPIREVMQQMEICVIQHQKFLARTPLFQVIVHRNMIFNGTGQPQMNVDIQMIICKLSM